MTKYYYPNENIACNTAIWRPNLLLTIPDVSKLCIYNTPFYQTEIFLFFRYGFCHVDPYSDDLRLLRKAYCKLDLDRVEFMIAF